MKEALSLLRATTANISQTFVLEMGIVVWLVSEVSHRKVMRTPRWKVQLSGVLLV